MTRQAPTEQPAFISDLPKDAALVPLIQAYLQGDYATVRRLAPELAKTTESAAVRDAALELASRIRPDPLARHILTAAAALLLLLIYWAYAGHAH